MLNQICHKSRLLNVHKLTHKMKAKITEPTHLHARWHTTQWHATGTYHWWLAVRPPECLGNFTTGGLPVARQWLPLEDCQCCHRQPTTRPPVACVQGREIDLLARLKLHFKQFFIYKIKHLISLNKDVYLSSLKLNDLLLKIDI